MEIIDKKEYTDAIKAAYLEKTDKPLTSYKKTILTSGTSVES